MDLPGMFEIVDIRPTGHFADFSLPGSTNVSIAAVIANPAYLNGTTPLVIVDRDGSLAMVVAGILSQKTARPIQALYGGLEAYWNNSAMPLPPATSTPAPAVRHAIPIPTPESPRAPKPATPKPPKKKSAGC